MSSSSNRHLARRAFVALAPLALTLASGCGYLFVSFDFDREVELAPGEVRGVVVRRDLDDLPAPFSSVVVEGGAVRRTGSDGRFSVKGLAPGAFVLRAEDDVDGDGFAERTALVSAVVRAGAPVSILPGDDTPVVSSVLLGAVRVDGTARVAGRLFVDEGGTRRTPDAAGLIGRVVVTREFDLPTADDEVFDLVTLGSEADAAVDGAGEFSMPSVGTGTFQLIAFLFERAPDGGLGDLVGASVPVKVRGVAGETIDLKDTPFVVERGAGLDARTVQFPLVPAVDVDAYLLFGPPGLELPPCESNPPDVYPAPFAHVSRTPVGPVDGDLRAELPVGLFDVAVCTVDGSDGPRGVLFQLAVAADPNDLPQLAATVTMLDDDPCGDPALPDCDGDGRWGLPTFSPESQARWATCVAQCQAAFGAVGAERRCIIDDDVYDCDDDGDGQPDVTENPACVGLGRGTDYDGDGLCSGQDPFPRCAANNADDCPANNPEFEPTIPDEYQGGTIGETVFDATFGVGGRVTFAGELNFYVSAAAPLDDGMILLVDSFDVEVEAPIRLWRIDASGDVVDTFGSGGLSTLGLRGPSGPLSAEPIAVVAPSPRAESFVLVLSRAFDDQGELIAITKVFVDSGEPDLLFGLDGTLLVDVATFGTTPGVGAGGSATDMVVDELDRVFVTGDFAQAGDRDLFVCPLDADTGDPLALFQDVEHPGACIIEALPHQQLPQAIAVKDDATLLIVGEELSSDSSFEPRGILAVRSIESPLLVEVATVPLSGVGSAIARDIAYVPEEGASYVGGELGDRAALWRVDEETLDLVYESSFVGSEALAVGLDGSRNVFLVGAVDRESGSPSLLVSRYSTTISRSEVVVHEVPDGETVLAAAALTAFVDDESKLVFAGASIPTSEGALVESTVWRLNPLGPNIDVVQEPSDGGTGEVGFDAGDGGLPLGGCVTHVDCDGVVDCAGLVSDVPMCDSELGCVCADPCNAVFNPVFVDGALSFSNAADVDEAVPMDTACIVGDVIVGGFTDAALAGPLSRVKRISGALTITSNSALTTIDMDALGILDGALHVEGNTGLFELDAIFPALRRVNNGSFIRFFDNPSLQTVVVSALLSRLEEPVGGTGAEVSGNACVFPGDSSCDDYAETCAVDGVCQGP